MKKTALLLVLFLGLPIWGQSFNLGIRTELFLLTKVEKSFGTEYSMLPLPTSLFLNAGIDVNKYLKFDLRIGPELIAQDLNGMKYALVYKTSPIKEWFYFLAGFELHQNPEDDRVTFGNYNRTFKILTFGIGFTATNVLSFEFAYSSTIGSNSYTYQKKILPSGEIQKIPIENFISTLKLGIGLNWKL